MNKQEKEARKLTFKMFNMDTIEEKDLDFKVPRWYYITRNRDAEMLLNVDRHGNSIWCEHDLQYIIPHMYNTAHNARKDLKRVGGHNVRMSKFQVIDGKSVWTGEEVKPDWK